MLHPIDENEFDGQTSRGGYGQEVGEQTAMVQKRRVSLRFADLPPGALSNSTPTKSHVFKGSANRQWETFDNKTMRNDPQGTVEGAGGEPVAWNSVASKSSTARPWCIVRFFLCFKLWGQKDCTLRKAYWLSLFNSVCAIVHLLMFILCIYAGWGSGSNFEIPVYRIRGQWESGAANGYTFVTTTNGMMPIRFDWLTASFFFLSFFFHFAAVSVSSIESMIPYYWRQLDLCFCWWRCATLTSNHTLLCA